MTLVRLCLLGVSLGSAAVVGAQTPVAGAGNAARSLESADQPANTLPINAYADSGPADAVAEDIQRDVGVSGSSCPTGYLCGQNQTGTNWLYSDLHATVTDELGIVRRDRVTCESFPPPGGWANQQPIDIVTWRATYLTDSSNGCNKTNSVHHFQIQFYTDNGAGKPNCATPVYSWSLVPDIATKVGSGTLNFGGTVSADEWEFTALLPTSVNMASGHFSIKGDGNLTNCYVLLGPSLSPEGDSKTWRWYNTPTPCYFWSSNTPGAYSRYDFQYCFGRANFGACCFDCQGGGTCTYTADFICSMQDGRFQAGAQCAAMSPLCGQITGACCLDNGSCVLTTCAACVSASQACCFADHTCAVTPAIDCAQRGGTPWGPGTTCATQYVCGSAPYCVGDLNCDGSIDFGDINPFVLYLTNQSSWLAEYPDCHDARSGDIDCDGTYGQWSFGDINPFVDLLSHPPIQQCPRVCPQPAPEPRAQGAYWGGPGSTCSDPNAPTYGCCTVAPGNPKEDELHNCVTDHYNGGCPATPPAFLTIPSLPYMVYGESGTYGNGVYRDMDWYEYTALVPQIYTMTVRAEFPPALYVMHAGSDNLCLNYWVTDQPVSGLACEDVQFVTHCLPAGKYYFVVAPNTFTGVACGADYKLTVTGGNCEPPAILCDAPDHTELSACNDNPSHVDENGGCNKDPNNPEAPNSFELLNLQLGQPYTLCGTLWATAGIRDLDWYRFTLTERFALSWTVDTEVPIGASILFDDPGTCGYAPPTCNMYYMFNAFFAPYTMGTWDYPELAFQPGTYFFLVLPKLESGSGIFYGYPCGVGNPYHDYRITLTASPAVACPDPCQSAPSAPEFQEGEPTCGQYYVDITDGGCDAGTPYHTKPIAALDLSHDYCGASGAWYDDPNNSSQPRKDYDWYEFTTPGSPATGTWEMYLYASFPATWEIWPANNCAAGPIEGLEMPACYGTSVKPAQCYAAGTTYWLRVYPTDLCAICGDAYYLGLHDVVACTPCSIDCSAAIDNDDPCDDVNDFDTNVGCDGSPVDPAQFLTIALGNTYCGRSYAKPINGVGYLDPDWFKIRLDGPTNLRLRIQAEFPAFVAVYTAGGDPNNPCVSYDRDNPKGSALGYREMFTACAGTAPTELDLAYLVPGDYVGVIFPIDYFGNVLANYYPCGHLNRYRIAASGY